MTQTIRITQPGGVEALKVEDVPLTKPQAGEVRIRQMAVGVNFIDVYHRSGLYALPSYPAGIGLEASGVVEEAGEGASLKPGDRVAYCGGAPGSYAAERVIAEKHLVKIPDGVSHEVAAASILKGLTAQFLLRKTFRVEKGHAVLIHAAAGGVGLLACQWAKHLGATVIGTVSSPQKAALAKQNGCDFPIIYTQEPIVARVRELTNGTGVDVAYDSVGKTTFMDSLDCLRKFGMLVSYGNASGAVPAFEPLLLSKKGSLFVTRPTLMHHIEDRASYQAMADELFGLLGQGALSVHIGARYALAETAQAHIDLEARKTVGSTLLLP